MGRMVSTLSFFFFFFLPKQQEFLGRGRIKSLDSSAQSTPFYFYISVFFSFFFWPYLAACRILVLRPGIEPVPRPMEAQSINHWTVREVPPPLL